MKLVYPDQMAPQDCLDFLDNSDLEDNRDQQVQLGQWVQQVCQVYEGQQEKEVLVENLVSREKQVPQVQPALLGLQDPEDQLEKGDNRENLVYQAATDNLDTMVHLDCQVNADNRATPVLLDLLVQLGYPVCAEQEVALVSKAHKVKWDYLGLQDDQENEVHVEKLDLQDHLGPLERQDYEDEEENKDLEGNRAQLEKRVPPAQVDREDSLGNKAPEAQLEKRALLAHQVSRVHKVHKVLLVCKEQEANQACLANLA